jgi:hypothetical protein
MRVNVYNEELTNEVEAVWVEPRPGRRYLGIRFFLASSAQLHNTPNDDDRSAVTLWVGSVSAAERLLTDALGAVYEPREE